MNTVSDRLQKVSEQLIEANAINKGYHHALDQQRAKVEIAPCDCLAQGAISMLKWVTGIVLGIAIPGGTWSINSINQLKQDMAIIQSHREDNK